MRFETGQLRSLIGITTETLRHWKRALPPLFGRDGRSDGYVFHEVVALAVISAAVQQLAVPISRFTAVAERLFSEIAIQTQPGRKPLVLCITRDEVIFAIPGQLPEAETLAIVRVEPIVQRLLLALRPGPHQLEAQLDLPLEGARVVGLRGLRVG